MWEDMIISFEVTNGYIYASTQGPRMDDESKEINKWDSKVACMFTHVIYERGTCMVF